MSADAMSCFLDVCEAAPEELDSRLAARCGGDPVLIAEVRVLLEADRRAHALDSDALGAVARRMSTQVAREPEQSAERPPERVGPYRLLRHLGSGGMGAVYLGEQAHPRRQVALKTVHPWLRTGADLARFHDEVQALGSLLHPAIPQVYEALEVDGVPWLAMELVTGSPVHQVAVGWSERRVVALLVEVCDAVQHAATAGLIHGDLKPDNVLVGADGRPRVLDFGLARRVGEQQAGLGGTRGYMSPGQHAEQPPDVRTDVFALGRLGAALLPEPHPDLEAIFARASRDDRSARYPDAGALQADLRRFLAHRPVTARAATPAYRAERLLTRHRRGVRALAAAGALALLLAAVAAALEQRQEAHRRAQAEEALAVLEAAMARTDPEEAARALQAFAESPGVQGTPALVTAWVNEAERRSLRGDDDGGLDAIARAYAIASDAEQKQQVTLRLAGTLQDAGRLTALAQLGASLSPQQAASDLARPLALAQRDLSAAARADPSLAATLAGLSRGTAMPDLTAPIRGSTVRLHRGRLYLTNSRQRSVDILDAATLQTHASLPFPDGLEDTWGHAPRILPGSPPLLVGRRGDALSIWRIEEAGLVASAVLRQGKVLSMLRMPDGRLLAGLGHSPRGLTMGAEDGDGWRFTDPHPPTTALESDVLDLDRGDLDGDGTEEIVASLGPWGAMAVRVYTPTDDGLAVRADRLLGEVSWVRVLRSPDGPRILALRTRGYDNARIFGEAAPAGAPEGLYILRLEAEALVESAYVPAGPWPDLGARAPVIADLDGDGIDEILQNLTGDRSPLLRILRWSDAGTLQPVLVRGLLAIDALQLDDDPASEVLLGLDGGAFLAGHGDTPLPPLSPEAAAGRAPRTRAEELIQLGLDDVGIAALTDEARRTIDPDEAAALWRRVAQLTAASDRSEIEQAEAWQEAAAHTPPGPAQHAAVEAAAAAWLAAGEHAAALPLLEALPAPAAQLAAVRAIVEVPSVSVPTEVPIAAAWHITDPRSIAPSPGAQRLRLWSRQGTILTRPLTFDGGMLGLEVDLTLSRLELASGIRVLIRRPGSEEALLQLHLRGSGGGLKVAARLRCRSDQDLEVGPAPSEEAPLSLRLSVARLPDGQTHCRVDDQTTLLSGPAEPIPSGPLELVVQSGGAPGWSASQLTDVTLRAVRITGARLAPFQPPPAPPTHPLLAALESEDLEAAGRLAAVEDPAVLADLLRTHHRALLPILVDLDPDRAAVLLGESWSVASRWLRSPQTRALLDTPLLSTLRSEDPEYLRLLLQRAALAGLRGQDEREHRILDAIQPLAVPPISAEVERQRAACYLRQGDRESARAHISAWQAEHSTDLDRQKLAWLQPELAALLDD